MESLYEFGVWAWDFFRHMPEHLNRLAADMGPWLYVLLFCIIFAETGLVVTPFLPGDSLLFAVGALSATPGSPIHLWQTFGLLTVAAIIGDAVNYHIGKWIGPRIFKSEKSWLLNRKHLMRAHEFYERHGGKTIILARFIPIVRTFAPFVAGIGSMTYAHFAAYNVIGAIVWVGIFLFAGSWFGHLEFVQKNFEWITVAIIVVSVLPVVIEFMRARFRKPELDPRPVTKAEEPAQG